MKQSYRSDVIAVVVTYQPELDVLEQLLDTLVMQVGSIVVVDNGSNANLEVWNNQSQRPAVEVILLGENRGIAAAQNEGIQYALDKGAGYVLLMDQDSVPSQDMVEKLIIAMSEAEKKAGPEPIAAGPVCVDSRTGTKSFFAIERNGIPSRWQPAAYYTLDNFSLEVSFLISSGTLINLTLLSDIGGMRSNYFIDHVDTEWCFRARGKGYILLGVPGAEMQHSLGDKVSNVWFFGWRHVAYHSTFRDYYMFRNTLLMLRDAQMSVVWRLHFLWRLVQFSCYFLIFAPLRMQRFYYILMGIVHGLCDIRGKVDLKAFQCEQIPTSALEP